MLSEDILKALETAEESLVYLVGVKISLRTAVNDILNKLEKGEIPEEEARTQLREIYDFLYRCGVNLNRMETALPSAIDSFQQVMDEIDDAITKKFQGRF